MSGSYRDYHKQEHQQPSQSNYVDGNQNNTANQSGPFEAQDVLNFQQNNIANDSFNCWCVSVAPVPV